MSIYIYIYICMYKLVDEQLEKIDILVRDDLLQQKDQE